MTAVAVQPVAPVRPRLRRVGPGRGPIARPRGAGLGAASQRARPGVRSCQPAPTMVGHPAPSQSWRLTERGQALVLLLALVIATAAVVVLGLTAVQVTGDNYRSGGTAGASVDAGR